MSKSNVLYSRIPVFLYSSKKKRNNNNNILNNNIMKQKTKQLIMTLVALLALTTHAWADDPKVYNSGDVSLAQLEQGDILMPGVTLTNVNNSVTPYLFSERYSINGTIYGTGSRISSFPFSIGENGLISAQLGGGSNPTSNCMPITEDGKTGNAWVVVNKTTSYDGTSIRIGGTIYPKPTPFAITWSAETPNTASIDKMPAGNVTVSVEYFPQAEFAKSTDPTPVPLAPTAIANVPANTDAPIVTAGTVANIGTSEVKQGTLMYFVSQPTGNTAPTAPTSDTEGWSENVPTANGLKEGNAYVWYYIEGAEPASIAERTDDNTRSDSDIKPLGTTGIVTLGAEPTYDVSLNKTGMAEGEPAKWSAKSTNVTTAVNLGEADLEGVKKSETVTVTYSGSKKVIGVKAEKKAAEPVADIIWDGTNVTDLNVESTYASYTKEGVKLSGNAEQVQAKWNNSAYLGTPGMEFITMESGGFTFTAPTGKAFTKIEMKAQGSSGWGSANLGTGWAYNTGTVTWTGSAASTVKLLKDADMFSGDFISSIAFYLSE